MAALAETTSYRSTYLFTREPSKYGGKQEEYQRLAEEAISKATDAIKYAQESGQKLTETFFVLMRNLQEERHRIAVLHETPDSSLFGRYRAAPDTKFEEAQSGYFSPYTPLSEPYEEYNAICMDQLYRLLNSLKRSPESFIDKKVHREETVLGRKCSFACEILDYKDLDERKMDKNHINSDLERITGSDKADKFFKDYAVMNSLRVDYPAFYTRLTTYAFTNEISQIFPSTKLTFGESGRISAVKGHPRNRKNAYVMGTLHLEVMPGRSLPLMRCITWLYQDYESDPLDRMKDNSTIVIIHQDPFLVEETLHAIAQVFESAVSWNSAKDSLEDLKGRVALLRFSYAHCMPCFRGDGAVGDWIELAIYRFHGFRKTHYNEGKLACFEPLASLSLSRYLENYASIITVT